MGTESYFVDVVRGPLGFRGEIRFRNEMSFIQMNSYIAPSRVGSFRVAERKVTILRLQQPVGMILLTCGFQAECHAPDPGASVSISRKGLQ